MTPVSWMIVVAIAALAGWIAGRRTGGDVGAEPEGDDLSGALSGLAADLRAGRRPGPGAADAPALEELRNALSSWVPRNEEREVALRQALGRVAAFLDHEVAGPLRESLDGGGRAREEAIRTALGAIQDLEFFLREPLAPDEVHNLVPVVQEVTREYIQDWEIAVRIAAPPSPARARIHRDTFMDAVYLLLHNAGQFGGGGTIDVAVEETGDGAVVTIRDRGPGFSEEALERAHDLFYTTTESGLGLGIPFARRIVEGFGGSLEIANLPEGTGAQVRLVLPAA